MAVLMSYHKLVERESKNVDYHWKAITVILLILAVASCLGVSLCLQQIITAFDNRCILGADLQFEDRLNDLRQTQTKSESFSNATTRRFLTLNEIFDGSYATILGKSANKQFPENQVKFLENKRINDHSTNWGRKSSCDFGVYIPIFQCCFGIIIATMFLICGRGGKADQHSFLPQPWRIVTPALFFFLVMTIIAIINLVIIEGGMNDFCASFEQNIPDIGCDLAMNRFMILNIDKVKLMPGTFHKMLIAFDWTLFSCWLTSFIIMLARIIFVIDFQLVRITVKTMEYEKADKSSNFKVVEVENDSGSDESIGYGKLFEEINEVDKTRSNPNI